MRARLGRVRFGSMIVPINHVKRRSLSYFKIIWLALGLKSLII